MHKRAFKVVLNLGCGVFSSAVERSKRNCVYYSVGQRIAPNQGAFPFLYIFDTIEHAREFRCVVFSCKGEGSGCVLSPHKKAGCPKKCECSKPCERLKTCGILLVQAENVTKTTPKHDKRLALPIAGNLFCTALTVIKKME